MCYNAKIPTKIASKQMSVPTTTPAEVLNISPEALEVANCYLQLQSIAKVSESLDIPPHAVADFLDRREVKAYLDNVFFDMGFNNRHRMRELMDTIIKKKLEEMDESEMSSGKDILDILAMSHKMSMDYLDKQLQLEKLRGTNIRNQVNVQINENGGSNYGSLIERIINAKD